MREGDWGGGAPHTVDMAETSSGQVSTGPKVFNVPTTRFPSVTKHGAKTALSTEQTSTCPTELLG